MKNSNTKPAPVVVEEEEQKMETNSPNPPGSITPAAVQEQQEKANTHLKSFNELLDTLASSEDKQKSLWRQIYENAITDRMNGYVIWVDLYREVQGKPSEHAIHGPNLSKYMERMSKANDQLIKLAELVANAKKKDTNEFTQDSLYEELEKT